MTGNLRSIQKNSRHTHPSIKENLKNIIKKDHFINWFILSVFLLLFFSKNSPLYPTNDWVDTNAFLTVGKGMFHGLVPYKDLFEQKGPLLYLVYGLSAVLTNGFFGVYLLQCLAMAVNLVCSFKILKLYLPEKLSLVLSIFFPPLILNYSFFRQGGSVEELCIPILMILLYQTLKSVKNLSDTNPILTFTNREYFWQGLSVALIFFSKFSLLGPWIAFYIFLAIYFVIKKEGKAFFNFVLYSGIGFLVGTVPWLIYFIAHDAFKTFLQVYIFVNSSAYNSTTANLVSRLVFIFTQMANNFRNNLFNLILLTPILAIVPVFKSISSKLVGRLLVFAIMLSTAIFIYVGMKGYIYYFLFFIPFGIIGLLFIGKLLMIEKDNLLPIFDTRINVIVPLAVFLAFLLAIVNNSSIEQSLFYPLNPTVRLSEEQPPKTAQKLFAEYMHSHSSKPTLLNYRFLDGGFYQAANILPTERHFELQNIDHNAFSDNFVGQTSAITEKKVQFFVMETGTDFKEQNFRGEEFLNNYDLVMTHSQSRDHVDRTYWLFQRKE